MAQPAQLAERHGEPDPRRWRALGVLAIVQFLIVIDNTVVNVALPSVQRDLVFAPNGLAWVVNGYLLTAGGLLLFGGRLADLLGRRRMFLLGTALFGLASAGCGAAGAPWALVASRVAQGVGEALASPAALSTVALLFPGGGERAKALGLWGALGGLGATAGVLLSGVITQLVSWRWVFFVNVPFVVAALVLLPRLVPESRAPGRRRLDVLGAVLVTAALATLVDALLTAARAGWGGPGVLGQLAAGLALLAGFAVTESRRPEPLVPPRFFTHRARVSANVATVFLYSALAAMFLLLTLYLQDVLGYPPIRAGLAYLPFCLAFGPGFLLSARLTRRFGLRITLVAAFGVALAGMLLLSRIDVRADYPGTLLPALVVLAVGFGMGFPAVQAAALRGVSAADAGLAAGVQTTVQALSSALGVAAFLTVALRVTAAEVARGLAGPAAAVAGYRWAYHAMAAVFCLGAVAALFVANEHT